jgi:hypothetical protein
MTILDQGVNKEVPDHLIPKHLYISDCIILSAPLFSDDMLQYNGLEIISMRISQLTHRFLDAGYLIRGGVSIGPVWHTDNNIIGPAYQEAYKLEENGYEPCVKLSPTAHETWLRHSQTDNRMCLMHDDKFIVNGLHDAYMPRAYKSQGISNTFNEYAATASQNINNLELDPKVKEKWEWFNGYLKSEKKLNG